MRLFISAVAIVACAAVAAWAADDRATFILSNGQHVSGDVVHHGGNDANLIDDNFNLRLDNGREQSYGENQVAVIDFAGGQPSATELQQIPASGQFLVLRNGQSQTGTLVNLLHGTTLVWRNASGQEQQYGISDVARVYLNPQAARVAYNAPAAPSAVGTSGTAAATPAQPGEVRVEANQAWTDTGIQVKKGDRVAFHATGQITFGQSAGQTAGPDGNGAMRQPNYPVSVMPVGGLIGKVGSAPAFPIGSNTQPIVMPADGRLMLGVNDNELGDNSGYFSVVVTKQ
ncbi:MAG TPA: LecA/PA-IL family lectin [Vicinamibacterales bacterium]|nr:LecA/PA-IL family lectin [Vicinamibacterales bacterium]